MTLWLFLFVLPIVLSGSEDFESMRHQNKLDSQMRLIGALWCAFLLMGGVLAFLAVHKMAEINTDVAEKSFRHLARTISATIDGDRLHRTMPKATAEARQYVYDELGKIRDLDPSIDSVGLFEYKDGFRRVAESHNPAVDPDRDGVINSNLMSAAKSAVESQAPAFDINPNGFRSSVIPVLSHGKPIGAIVITASQNNSKAGTKYDLTTAALLTGVAAVLGIIFATLFAFTIPMRKRTVQAIHASSKAKTRATQVVLILLVCAASLASAITVVGAQRSSKLDTEWIKMTMMANDLSETLDQVRPGDVLSDEEAEEIASNLSLLGCSSDAQRVRSIANSSNSVWPDGLATEIRERLSANASQRVRDRDAILNSVGSRSNLMVIVAIVAALLGGVGLMSVLRASAQQRAVSEATEERDAVSELYQQLINKVPIGLFRFRGGNLINANVMFTSQLAGGTTLPLDDAFNAAISDEDRQFVRQSLAYYEQERTQFSFNFRMYDVVGSRRYIECRGMPTFLSTGEFDHLLVFCVDITESVEATLELMEKNEALAEALEIIERTFDQTLGLLIKAIDAKDPYTAGHSERVMQYSVALGQRLGLSAKDLATLQKGALVHDIGKIGVPDGILTKPDKLTDEEFEIVKLHPEIGYKILMHMPSFQECLPIVRYHHERLNGTGYPCGLKADELSLSVRICAVADVYDALTSDRSYRKGMSDLEALRIITREAQSGHLDPQVVDVLTEMLFEAHQNVSSEQFKAA